MVRGKIEMKRIENAATRQVTFSKRRNGILKKAFELSVLCDAEVAIMIFSQKGRLYEFSSTNIDKILERRYREQANQFQRNDAEVQQYMQNLKHETTNMAKEIDLLEIAQRKLLGQDIGSCSLEEVQEIGSQLERGLKNIILRKAQSFEEEIKCLKAKERVLIEENARLCEKSGLKPWQLEVKRNDIASCTRSTKNSEVETQLFIGLPYSRC